MNTIDSLNSLKHGLRNSDRMPLVFLGHGSPMNAIESTANNRAWTELGEALPRPQAILVVSAHWMTHDSTLVDISAMPRTIHDFYGFPEALYEQQYPAPGAPELARDVVSLLASHHAESDDRWGLDHGAWTVLKFLYPDADVPTFQLSIDMSRDLDWHVGIGRELAALRERGVLILGSGNVVHNLGTMRMQGKPLDFALEFDQLFTDRLVGRDVDTLSDRKRLGSLLSAAHPSLDHYLPALTVAGASSDSDSLSFMTESIELGSVSMRSFVFH